MRKGSKYRYTLHLLEMVGHSRFIDARNLEKHRHQICTSIHCLLQTNTYALYAVYTTYRQTDTAKIYTLYTDRCYRNMYTDILILQVSKQCRQKDTAQCLHIFNVYVQTQQFGTEKRQKLSIDIHVQIVVNRRQIYMQIDRRCIIDR